MHELLELDAGMHGIVGRGLDLVVVNAVFPNRFTAAEARKLRRIAAQSSAVRAALAEHRQAEAHAARIEWLRERIAAPVVTLPFLFATEIRRRELERLAERFMS